MEKRKAWRLKKYGDWSLDLLSPTTRKLFKKWKHRIHEIIMWQKKNGW